MPFGRVTERIIARLAFFARLMMKIPLSILNTSNRSKTTVFNFKNPILGQSSEDGAESARLPTRAVLQLKC